MTETLADRIRERLKAVGKSASAASTEAGLSNTVIRDILSGRVTSPQLGTLVKLTGPLECSIEFLTGSVPKPPRPPEPYDSYRAFDPHPTDITADLAVGVFKEPGIAWKDDRPKTGTYERYVVYNDPDRPDWPPLLYMMTDQSMEGAGIRAGDVLTAIAPPYGSKIELMDGLLVIAKRSIGEGNAEEISAREVEFVEGEIRLVCRPGRGSIRPVTIREPSGSIRESIANFMPDYYWSDEGSVTIEGVIIRLTREL